LAKNHKINSVWAGPISGDGSLAIGAAWSAVKNYSNDIILGLETIYLGTEISRKSSDVEVSKISKKFKILEINQEKEKIRLGIKQLTQDPFEFFMNKKIFDVVTAIVVSSSKDGILFRGCGQKNRRDW